MYIKSITDTIFTRLFDEPQNILNENTFFKRPTKEYSAMYLEDNNSQIPVKIAVNSSLDSQIKTNQSAANNITNALSANRTIQEYLSDTLSNLENVYSLAKSAADSTASGSARTDLNKTVQSTLEQIDKIYNSAKFNGEYIMQGGQGVIAAGPNGEETTFAYGNVNRTKLGINDIDVTTQEDADKAVAALSNAIDSLKIHQGAVSDDESLLQSRYDAGTSALKSTENLLNYDYSRKFTQTAFENSIAVINNKFDYAINVQSYTLSNNTANALFNSLTQISETIKSQQTESLKAQQAKQTTPETASNISPENSNPQAQENTAVPLKTVQPNAKPLLDDELKKTEIQITTLARSNTSSLYELLQKQVQQPSASTNTPAPPQASTTTGK